MKQTLARTDREGWRAGLEGFLQAPNSSAKIGNSPYHRAWWYSLLGRPDEALAELEVGLETRPYNMVYTAVDPGFAQLRTDSRFLAVVEGMRIGAQGPLVAQER